MLYTITFNTALGLVRASADDEGVISLFFNDTGHIDAEKNKKGYERSDEINSLNDVLALLKLQIDEYFEGRRKEFSIPLVIEGSGFRKKVWEEVLKIPFGETISYSELAERTGNPGSVRAVANANAENGLAILVPCHRIIGQDGGLTGYAGGLWRKKWLIDHERKYSGKPYEAELFGFQKI
jgi:O-6-methylguanine DNA methyltransferase